jgi:protein TonB
MRTSTFFVSLVVHALMIAAAVVVPLVATDVLPKLHDSTTFIAVTPQLPTMPSPPQVRQTAPSAGSAVHPDAAPVVEPPSIDAETGVQPLDVPTDPGAITGGVDFSGLPGDAPPADVPPPPLVQPVPIRIGGDIRPPQKIHHAAPEYPAIARSARVTGIVILEAVIAENGGVRDVKVLRSIPLLDNAAVDAVRQWRFTPTLLNGVPVPVVMTITVAFNLN